VNAAETLEFWLAAVTAPCSGSQDRRASVWLLWNGTDPLRSHVPK